MTNYGSFQLIIVTFRCVAHTHLKCIRLLCGSSVEVMPNQSHDNQVKIQPSLWMKYAVLL